MRRKHFGDSYDIVKHCLLRWLSVLDPWSVHPMFTDTWSDADVASFSALIGAPLVSTEVLDCATDRPAYFAAAEACKRHLFLDPNTGVRPEPTRAKNAPAYIFSSELVRVVGSRPDRLTLVFDQCLARGREREGLGEKLAALHAAGIHGTAYTSHASFLLVSCDGAQVTAARRLLERDAHLPAQRFVDFAAKLPGR